MSYLLIYIQVSMLIKAQALATADQAWDLGSMEAWVFVVVLFYFCFYFIVFLVQWDENSMYSEGCFEDKKTKFFSHIVIYLWLFKVYTLKLEHIFIFAWASKLSGIFHYTLQEIYDANSQGQLEIFFISMNSVNKWFLYIVE